MKYNYPREFSKLILILLLSSFYSLPGSGQVPVPCGNTVLTEEPDDQPVWLAKLMSASGNLKFRKSISAGKSMNTIDTIPVVFHVLWNTAAQNVADSLIQRVLQIMNQDFSRLNPDTVNTPAAFVPLAGSIPYRFVLARRTPQGGVTNGIVRQQTNHAPWVSADMSPFGHLMYTDSGGSDLWGNCLNIYCCDISSSAGGIGFGAVENIYCMVDYTTFTSQTRVCTHEVGHCLGLRHVWGLEPSTGPFDCANDDGIADTPPQYAPSTFCPVFPLLDSCTSTGNGVMFMNYMDYSFGGCQNMFSAGQAAYMITTLTTDPSFAYVVNSIALVPVPTHDAGCLTILEPNGLECSPLTPVVRIKNWGADTLQTADIKYQIDGGTVQTYSWAGSLANLETSDVTLPSVSATSGNHILTAYTESPDGYADADFSNDTAYTNFSLTASAVIPLTEGFEGATFPPAGWVIYNPNNDSTFNRTSLASFLGNYSMIHNAQGSVYASIDEISIHLNLASAAGPVMTFWHAYSYNSFQGFTDTLDVLASSDCGNTFTQLFRKFETTLLTAPLITGQLFIPTATQWKPDTVDLSPFALMSDVIVKFRVINPWGKQLYIDNINIQNIVGVHGPDPVVSEFNIFPTLSDGSFQVALSLKAEAHCSIAIYDMTGKMVRNVFNGSASAGHRQMDVDVRFLEQGIYLCALQTEEGIFVKKLIIQK